MFCSNCGFQNHDTAKFCGHCGQPLKPAVAPIAGITPPVPSAAPSTASPPPVSQTAMLATQSVLRGRYFIVKLLSQGGMGAAYLAQDQQTFGRKVVIKEMLPYYTTPAEKIEAERNFAREGQVLASLNHPGIPQINDYFIEADKYYLVMTLAEGENLEQRLTAAGGRLPEKDVVDYGLQVAQILTYLGDLKPPVIHRDIKPANIILNKQTKHVTLVDFGIAKAKPGTMMMSAQPSSGAPQSTPMGTTGYAPPEQYQGRTESRSDVYALAATMHHLLTGIDPRQSAIPFDFVPAPSICSDVSAALDSILRRALDANVNNRPTARQLEKDLKDIATPSVVKHVSAASEFHFRSGETAKTVEELAQKAETHWDDGAYHLMQGHYEPWLRGQNRHDLANKAEGIRQRGGDPSAGLEEFLRALNPQLPPPVLAIGMNLLDFGTVTKGESRELDLPITNRGRGYLYGALKSNVPWITLSKSSVGCGTNQTQTLKITLDSRAMKEGPHNRPAIEVDTNGGRQTIVAQTQIAWAPALAVTPAKRLSFGDVLARSTAPAVRTLTITNSGGGTLQGKIACLGGWFYVSDQGFSLTSGQKAEVQAVANVAGLVVGIYEGEIAISSNGGDAVVPTRLGVKKAMYDLSARALRWSIFAALAFLSLFSCSLTMSLGTRGILGLAPINLLGTLYADFLRRFTVPSSDLVNMLGALTLLIIAFAGLVFYVASRALNPALDEIEDFYHARPLADEIPDNRFDGWRHIAVMVLLTFFGLPIGVRFNTALTNDWLGWGLLIGPLAGAMIGGSLTVIGARVRGVVDASSRLSAFERVFFAVGGMAIWGAMLNATRGAGREWLPAFVWAMAGFVIVSDSLRLPSRLQWLLAPIRPSLIITFFGYILEAEIYALISFFRYGRATFLSVDAFYTAFPGWTDPIQVMVDLMLIVALLTGGSVGLIAVNDASLQRKRVARTVGLALLPALLLGVLGMFVGAVVFWVLTLGRGWGLGVLLVTAAIIAAGFALFRLQAPLLERGEIALKETLARLLKNRPLPGWLSRFSLVALARDMTPVTISITAMLAAMLLPLAMQIAFSAMLLLMCLAVLAIGLGVVLAVILIAARSQTKPRNP